MSDKFEELKGRLDEDGKRLGLVLPPFLEASSGYLGCRLDGERGADSKLWVQLQLVSAIRNLKEIFEWTGADSAEDFSHRFVAREPNWDGVGPARAYRIAILTQKAAEIMVEMGLSPSSWDDAVRVATEAQADLENAGLMAEIDERHEACRCSGCRVLRGERLGTDEAPDDF